MDAQDCFDKLPDPVILVIFNGVKDIKSLIRCKAVSTRFNVLVPQTDNLCLKVDKIVSAGESENDDDSLVAVFFRSVFKPLFELVAGKEKSEPVKAHNQNSPAMILRGFERIKSLEIELPSGDLRLEKGSAISVLKRASVRNEATVFRGSLQITTFFGLLRLLGVNHKWRKKACFNGLVRERHEFVPEACTINTRNVRDTNL